MDNYSDLYNLLGDDFNIEVVCPDYLSKSQCVFTWHRDERGVGIVSGYDFEEEPDSIYYYDREWEGEDWT